MDLTEKSADRETLVRRLNEDLIGPRTEDEALTDRPTDVYLTGILWPPRTEMGGEDDDTLAIASSAQVSDSQNDETEGVPASYLQKPSVAGISFCVALEKSPRADVIVEFGRYCVSGEGKTKRFLRKQVKVQLNSFNIGPGNRYKPLKEINPDAEGTNLHLRSITSGTRLLITLSLINESTAGEGRDALECAALFQTHLEVKPAQTTKFLPRPASRNNEQSLNDDLDERSNDLLFRNVYSFASGHVCAAFWGRVDYDGDKGWPTTDRVFSTWIPSSIVPGVDNEGHDVFDKLGEGHCDPLSALELAKADSETLCSSLSEICGAYSKWIDETRSSKLKDLSSDQQDIAKENLDRCEKVLDRMWGAVKAIEVDPRLRRAFQLCNLAMHTQHEWDSTKTGSLRWRPFQIGFLLLSAVSTVRRDDSDRNVMDLLWFPTGGGKTEAYLALIALVAFYRRLSEEHGDHGGVASIMRYTLRLLTTQQFARSASMIVACEAIRQGKVSVPEDLRFQSSDPFSLGLWVGSEASPNRRSNAFAALHGLEKLASPAQLADCPVCSTRLVWAQAAVTAPVIVSCTNEGCIMFGPLPVWTVDEDVYQQRPTLLIGTVDKFAQIVRRPETNSLFGIDVGVPPDLIIQDELHLISGPLGTVAAVYESAFDILFSNAGQCPKIIGSTATIRRASEQVYDLFHRDACQFPPPGVNHEDSGFAVHNPNLNGRRYVGVTTAGRSAKFTLQAVSASLLQSAASAFKTQDAKDPYFTLLGYFNSLRELGGALVLMQDDVTDSIDLYKQQRSEAAARPIRNVEELTSRRTQEEILEMLGKLAIKVGEPGALDVVLATNMVSVGVDISRLGLMVVNGQPKGIAEYIQATSRVGRGSVSGLVVAILNNAKARDRSRFETFSSWHQTLYRDVEATSVTPFASRARDRALHAALVAAVRHLAPGMLNRPNLNNRAEAKAQELIDQIVARAADIDAQETNVRNELQRRLDLWRAKAPQHYWDDYREKDSLLMSAERAAWKKAVGRRPGSAWPTLNSMRTVEAGTPFRLAPKLKTKGTDRA